MKFIGKNKKETIAPEDDSSTFAIVSFYKSVCSIIQLNYIFFHSSP